MLTEPTNSRSLDRRRVYIGEGLSFEIESETAWLEAEAIDLTHEGVGVAVVLATDITLPAIGEVVTVRYTGRGASGDRQRAVVRHVGSLQTGRGTLPRIGLSLVADTTRVADVDRRAGVRYPCPEALAAFAAASCPWFLGETAHFRIVQVGIGGMTLRTTQPHPPLPPRAELDFDLHLASIAHQRARARLTSVRRDEVNGGLEVGAAWVDPSRELLNGLSRYLLAGDPQLTPAALRLGGLPVRGVEQVVTYDYATSEADFEEILALRLHAHQAEGHLDGTTTADLRSPFDAHSRHLTCRFGGRIVASRGPSSSTAIPPAASTCRSGAMRFHSGCGTPASSRAERARRIRTSSAPGSTSRSCSTCSGWRCSPGIASSWARARTSSWACTATWASRCSRPGPSRPTPGRAFARTCSTAMPSSCCATSPCRRPWPPWPRPSPSPACRSRPERGRADGSRAGSAARRRGGAAGRHDLRADPARRGGAADRARARRPARRPGRGGRRRAGRAARAAGPGAGARRAALRR